MSLGVSVAMEQRIGLSLSGLFLNSANPYEYWILQLICLFYVDRNGRHYPLIVLQKWFGYSPL